MNDRPDAFERLRAANPVDPATVDGPDSPRAQQLLASILATQRTPEVAVVRRHRRPLVIVVALVAILGGAATWIITRPVTSPVTVSCYAQPALHGTQAGLVGVPLDVKSCAPYWEDGTLTSPDYPPGVVPPLVACVTDVGTFAVFPSNNPNLCETLGLAPPEPQSIEEAKPTLDLDHAISEYFATSRCIPIPQAVSDVRRILDEHGAADWTVTVGEQRPDRPCASLSFEPKSHTVRIVPIPEP
ncbi:hypothetical protein BMS3Abin02_00304 [bacterium BMS3Abin02]|nr:hypothetical protein BMS3Abin02_00304 [bacterium BMS3Abin02]HDL48507.1 hypothetical protein [Actinomycetota bacterium]